MTPRPRGKRTPNDSPASSSSAGSSAAGSRSGAAKTSKKKTATRRGRPSAGGAAEKRPPRVSLPPTMSAPSAKKPAAKSAPAKKPAAKPAVAARPAPKAASESSRPTPKPVAPTAREERPARSAPAPTTPVAPAPAPAASRAPAAPAPVQQRPQQQQHAQHGQQNNQPPRQHNDQRPQQQGGGGQRPPQQNNQQHGQNQPRQQQHNQPRPQGQQGQQNDRPQHRGGPMQSQHPRNQQHSNNQSHPNPNGPAHTSPAHAAPPAPKPPKAPIGNDTAEGHNKKAHEEIFAKDIRFADLGLKESVLKGVTDAGFEFPTSIQAKLIPIMLTGKDILGQAKTGTGKTASFALPMLSRLEKGQRFTGLVLVPTRELAIQVATDFRELGRATGLTALPVYGGQNINTQAQALARGPEIIVATPGRVMDMVQRGYMHHHDVKMVVLDEVDRMLDIGFRDDIRRILSACPKDRQTVFVSATLQPEVEQLARTFARDCEKIVASAGALTVALVKQYYLSVEPWDKKQLLLHLLTHEQPALTVVFCRTKRTVDNLAEYLTRKGIDAHAIHGDMQQGRRNRVIEEMRSGKLGVMIASDLASRGLDIEGISHVINYDLPEDPDLYVHRIGRTARAGRDGVAWALVTPEQGPLLTEIELLINAEIPKLDYPDFKPGPLPHDVEESRRQGAARAEGAKTFNRYAPTQAPPAATAQQTASGHAPSIDASKFPGGIVPSKLPPKVMYGRVKTARSMRQALVQPLAPKPPEATP